MHYGTKVWFKNEQGIIVEGLFLRTIKWEDDDAYYSIQLNSGDRISIPATTHMQSVDDGFYQPGSDCQV